MNPIIAPTEDTIDANSSAARQPAIRFIKIAVVTSYRLLEEALLTLLRKERDLDFTGTGRTIAEAMVIIQEHKPDILLLEPWDLERDGLEALQALGQGGHSPKLVLLFSRGNPREAIRMLSLGASGILSRESSSAELIEAIRTVASGKPYLTQEIQRVCAEEFLLVGKGAHSLEDQLSDREYQVMRMLALGHTNREVATVLCVSTKTVDTHRANLLRKLHLRNNADIARFAILHRYIDP